MQTKKSDRDSLSERQFGNRGWIVQGYMIWRPNTQFTPPTDVLELEDKLVVRVEIAGMRTGDFNISLLNHHLVVTGTRERPPMQGSAYHQVEIGYGDFRVDIVLPWAVEEERVSASYKDGFLQVELPRRRDRQAHVVEVNGEE